MHSDAGRTRSVFHRGRRASFTAPGAVSVLKTEWTREEVCSVLWPILACHLQTRSAFHRAHGVCSIADAERLSPRRGLFPFWKRSGRGSTRSVFHRAGCILRSIHAPDARGRFLRSAAFNIHNTPFKSLRMLKVFSVYWARTQNVFHHTVGFHRSVARLPFRARSAICRAVGFIRSVARRTREVTPAVLWPSSFCGFLRTWNVRLLRLGLYKYSEFTEKKKRSRLVLRKNRRAGRFCTFAAFGNGMGKECPAQAAA